ncbi:MAG TPA: acyl-CoA dehydrogenase family protein [Acidimicrobiales bacterium]
MTGGTAGGMTPGGMDRDERELFAKSVQHATANHTGAALDAALADLGWLDALAADRRTAVAVLFEHQGAANATSSALGLVVAATLGAGPDPGVGVVLPAAGAWGPPGRARGDTLTVRGLGLAGLADRAEALVVAAPDGSGGPTAVRVRVADLALRPIGGLDPALGLMEVTGEGVPAGERFDPGAEAWEAAVAAGRLALAHEILGASRSMLRLARDHATERIQFGRPIASFQAVRHRLAEAFVALEAAEAALDAGWRDGSPRGAALAKALVGVGARTTAGHAQQVLAGIGFTTEHGFHHHMRRARVLDQLLGSAKTLTRQLGEDLLRARRLPALLPL